MPRLEFVGQSTRDSATTQASPSRLVNLFREPSGEGMLLRSVPGSWLWAETGVSLMRDMLTVGSHLYALVGGNLYKVGSDRVVLDCGTVGFDADAALSSNGGKVLATAQGRLKLWDGTTLSEVTGLPFDRKSSVCYLGGYSVVAELGGKQFAWSDLSDPTSWPGLNFATADISDDAITRIVEVADTLFIFGARTVERWALTGQSGANAIARIGGGALDIGLLSAACLTRIPEGMAFVASNGTVCLWLGGPTVISTAAVNAAVADETPVSLFYYEFRGHGFVVVAFRNRPAWVYDMATQEWHERAYGRDGAWSARNAAFLDGLWLLGDDEGRLMVPTDFGSDFGEPLQRRAISRRIDFGGFRTVWLVEAFPRTGLDREARGGVVLTPGGADVVEQAPDEPILGMSGTDSGPAQIGMRLSHDGGRTFGKLRMRPVGETGKYETRVTWRALGAMRSAVMEFSTAAVDEVPILAEINMEVT